jgi:hypothetical protein
MGRISKMTSDAWNEILDQLEPWKELGTWHEAGSNCAIGHLSKIGPTAYLHWLYAPISAENVREGSEHLSVLPPDDYAKFLTKANGASFFKGILSLGGCIGFKTVT